MENPLSRFFYPSSPQTHHITTLHPTECTHTYTQSITISFHTIFHSIESDPQELGATSISARQLALRIYHKALLSQKEYSFPIAPQSSNNVIQPSHYRCCSLLLLFVGRSRHRSATDESKEIQFLFSRLSVGFFSLM